MIWWRRLWNGIENNDLHDKIRYEQNAKDVEWQAYNDDRQDEIQEKEWFIRPRSVVLWKNA